MKLKSFKLKDSVILRTLDLFPKSDKFRIYVILSVQIVSGVLDLFGVALFGALGALSVSGLGAGVPSKKVSMLLEFLGLAQRSFQWQVAVLGAIAALILVIKTIFTAYFSRKILFFLSHRSARLSSNLVDSLLKKTLIEIQSKSSQDHLFAVTSGANSLILGVLGTLVTMVSDISLLIIVGIGLLVVNPALALITMLIFSAIGLILYLLMSVRARDLGNKSSDLTVESSNLILQVLLTFRESLVRDTREYYSNKIGQSRENLAMNQAEMQFMPNISKYVIEASLIISGVGISAMEFLLHDATHAVATLALFLAAASRISPATIRIQQGALQIRSNIGIAKSCLGMIEDLKVDSIFLKKNVASHKGMKDSNFIPTVQISNVDFSYTGNRENLALRNINFSLSAGNFLAIVGPSGSGKTTLVDILLGVLDPNIGEVRIAGKAPLDAIESWPGAIAYVPQEVMIVDGTIRENVLLGFQIENASESDQRCWEALRAANLDNEIRSLPEGLDTYVGERGTKLSGGQRQRLGIARALYTHPKMLVLDEATSALDAGTELAIANSIEALLGKVTIVMIAHRLSTVRSANTVVYLENSEMVAMGTFEEVRSRVPNFDKQARLMGL
ncbi:MdlB ABC-type multidrug transport system, ATPase and permease components [Candidatus Nanopelagicaceae bacterium]